MKNMKKVRTYHMIHKQTYQQRMIAFAWLKLGTKSQSYKFMKVIFMDFAINV